jgi:sugar phosphate permease
LPDVIHLILDSTFSSLLGQMDFSFLASYGFSLLLSGLWAERCHLPTFLSLGLSFASVTTFMWTLAYIYDVHNFSMYIGLMIACGISNSTALPASLGLMGNWFSNKNRGVVLGIWMTCTCVGNITGSLIASVYINHNWGYSYTVLAAALMIMAVAIGVAFRYFKGYPEGVQKLKILNTP